MFIKLQGMQKLLSSLHFTAKEQKSREVKLKYSDQSEGLQQTQKVLLFMFLTSSLLTYALRSS